MRIPTTSKAVARDFAFATLGNQSAAEQVIKVVDGITKTAPDGRPLHRTALMALRVKDGQASSEPDRSVTLSVLEPSDLESGKVYTVSGLVWITPYVNSQTNRLALSVIAERVEVRV